MDTWNESGRLESEWTSGIRVELANLESEWTPGTGVDFLQMECLTVNWKGFITKQVSVRTVRTPSCGLTSDQVFDGGSRGGGQKLSNYGQRTDAIQL